VAEKQNPGAIAATRFHRDCFRQSLQDAPCLPQIAIGRLPIDKESLVFSFPDDREGEPMAKILITEDEDSLRIFVARALRLDGHETVEAPDGAAGLDALTDGGFDLLLSDIRMPVMDGIELAHKASAAHPALKILLMTGYADQRERADDLATKIVDVVSKPFSLPDIRRAVAQALAA
jgi:two-component system cell cycle response regulator CpdR